MTRIVLAALSALCLLVASCSGLPAFAQNLQANQLPVRGAVQSTDTIPCQPANANLEGCAPSAIATYVQQTAAGGTSGQVQINSSGAFAGVTVSGDGTLSSSGALTVTKSNGTAFGTFAFQNYASLPSASGSPPIAAGTVFPCIPASALDGCTGAQLIAYVSNGPIGADPTGAADSTSALQSWLNAGSPGVIPCGTYKTTATLTMETAANNGQQVRGSGAGSSAGAGACRTVIKPTSAVTTALIIDGTPISAWVMGIGLHDLVFDMTNMTDASTTSAIKQVQAYDVSYERVRVINDGTSKRGWLFNAGAYTTTLLNTQANIVDFEGTTFGNGVTTITVINHDGFQVVANYANGLKFLGGAYQGAGTHFSLTNTGDVDINTDVEGSGTYLAISGYSNYIRSHAELGGMASGFTEVSGSCAIDCEIWDNTANGSTYAKYLTSGEIALNNQGSGLNNNRSSFLSGSSTQNQYLYIGRTAGESILGVSANANDFVNGIAPGDTILGSTGSGEATWLMAGYSPVVKMTAASLGLVNGAYFLSNPPLSFLSGSSSLSSYFYLGLTSGTSVIGVAAAANSFANGTVAGDMVLGSYSTNEHTWLLCAGNPCWEGDQYGHQYTQGYPAPTAGTGTASVPSNGNDNAFALTAGTSVTSSAVTFSHPWAVAPKCIATSNNASAFPYISAVSTTALTLGWSASVSGASAYVHCEG